MIFVLVFFIFFAFDVGNPSCVFCLDFRLAGDCVVYICDGEC